MADVRHQASGLPKTSFMGSRLSLPFALVWLALCGVGCEVPAETRCSDIEEILRARAQQLPNDCQRDSDCIIVEVRPGVAAVTTQPLEDEEIVELQTTYAKDCGPFDIRYENPRAACEERDNQRLCVLTVNHVASHFPDMGQDLITDVACACQDNSDCSGATPRCDGCECQDDCGIVCAAVAECEMLVSSRLGQSATDCTARCRAALEDTPAQTRTLITCLDGAVCAEMARCTDL